MRPSATPSAGFRRGLTLIESLVLIAVVSTVLVLLAPAIVASREGARRAQCLDNLKQLALATICYENATGIFPPQSCPRRAGPHPADGRAWGASWLPPVLLYSEYATLFNCYNFSAEAVGRPGPGWCNATVASTSLSVLICPSDGQGEPIRTLSTGAGCGMTNYCGNYGGPGPIIPAGGMIVPPRNPAMEASALSYPVPFHYAAVTFASILDGAAQTALISERLVGAANPGEFAQGHPDHARGWRIGSVAVPYHARNADARMFVDACRLPGPTVQTPGAVAAGERWSAADPIEILANSYNHFGPPNQPACGNPGEPRYAGRAAPGSFVGPLGSAPPSSRHWGGVGIAWADGSVRFVRNEVDLPVWWAQGTRAGGEPVGLDGF